MSDFASSNLYKGMKTWTAYYRHNPHKFAKDYLGINLFLYQTILLWAMNKYSFFMYIAARGQGKSYLIAVYTIIRAILYPNSQIIIASGTKGQARLIITQKIMNIYNNSPNLRREIKDVKTGANETFVLFKNGSKIEAVVSNDNSRGYRANILIVDEFRLVAKSVLDEVLIPFLNVNRIPPYLSNPKYKHLSEENKEIYISSSWYKNHWIWDSFKSYLSGMIAGKDYFVAVLDWRLSVFHGLLSKQRISNVMTADDFDQTSFDIEYEALFIGEGENAYFKLDDIQSCRTLPKAFYPISNFRYLEDRTEKGNLNKHDVDRLVKKYSNMPKKSGEVRIISMDVALMGSNKILKNDTTAYILMRLLPENGQYRRDVAYIETLSGTHSEKQAIRLKQLYTDFQADYVALDAHGNGMSIYDDCVRILYDEERDIEYEAWTAFNNDRMDERKMDANALPVIFAIKADTIVNHEVATSLRSSFEKRKIRLLINDIEAREDMIANDKLLSKSTEEQVRMLKPFLQSTATQNELVSLGYEIRSGSISIKEEGNATKDRYSAIGYGNYLANVLERDLVKQTNDDLLDYCLW